MKILVVGSLRKPEKANEKPDEDFVKKNTANFQAACEALGGALARRKHTIMVGVPDWAMLRQRETVATFIVEGASRWGDEKKTGEEKKAEEDQKTDGAKRAFHKIIFYGPQDREDQDRTAIIDTLQELKKLPNIEIEEMFEGRGTSKARTIPYIADVDAVMLISGQEGTASIGYAAHAMGKPVIPITSLDGAAESLRQEVLMEDYDELIKQGHVTANQIRDLDAYWEADARKNKDKADRVVAAAEKLVEAYNLSKPLPEKKVVVDEQGMKWDLVPESSLDIASAIVSELYLLVVLAFLLWQLFDVWNRQFTLLNWIRFPNIQLLGNATFRIAVYASIGGGIGGIINGLRSCLKWHADLKSFGGRFFWKYFAAPWMGVVLGLLTFAFTRGGVAAFGGSPSTGASNLGQVLATFSVAVLAGYGSPQFFKWLDATVNRVFKISTVKVSVPLLINLTREEANTALQKVGLDLGAVNQEDVTEAAQVGKVIHQKPKQGKSVDSGSSVNITIGRSSG